MRIKIILASLISMSLLSGCASNQYAVMYDSTPQSAMVVCNGQSMGYTPLTLYYPKTAIDAYGNLQTTQCKSVWSSGATAYYTTTINTAAFPDGVRYTNQRPSDVDGYSTDSQMDYQKKMNDAAQRQRNYESFNQSMQQMRTKQTYCNQIGTQVFCNTY